MHHSADAGVATDPLSVLRPIGELADIAHSIKPHYCAATPFPHAIIDHFLPERVAENLFDEFPAPHETLWKTYDAPHERKLEGSTFTSLPPFCRTVLTALNSAPILDFLSFVTGIPDLLPDPYFAGAGLHQIVPGGKLDVHVDFNRHNKLNLERRVNLLVYLNHKWSDDYGGHLELWSADKKQCEKRVLPIFNRCVIFSTTTTSYHGHPVPLTCPKGMSRKSIALYYYSTGHSSDEVEEKHSTLWLHGPTREPMTAWAKTKLALKAAAKELLPPIVTRRVRGY